MLTITEEAAEIFLLAMGDVNAVQLGQTPSGVRISRKTPADGTSERYRLEVIFEADEHDAIINAPYGLRVYIAPDAVPQLASHILDGSLDDAGHMMFILTAT